jgi:hypothetical protein
VREADVHTGNYALSMLWLDPGRPLVTDGDIGEIENGESLTGTFNQSGDLDAAYFDAEAGDVVKLRMGDRTGSSAFDMVMYVYGPDGGYITSHSHEYNADVTVVVSNSGTHMVVMREADVHTGNYALSALWVDAGHALVGDTHLGEIENGESLSGTIDQSGDMDGAWFTGQAGDIVKIRAGDKTGSSAFDLVTYLYGPDGEYITSASGEYNAEMNATLPEDGVYTILVREADVHGGNYALSMLWIDPGRTMVTDTDIGEIENGECLTGSFNQSGDLDAAYFDAEVGDVVKLRMGDRTGSSAFDMVMYVYGPDGSYIGSHSGEYNAEVTVAVTNSGTHMVVMREADVHTGGYALSALWVDAGHALVGDTHLGEIENGESLTGTINQSGDMDGAWFTAQAGDVVKIRAGDKTGSSAFDLVTYLYGPDGEYITSASGEYNAEMNVTIPANGVYTILVREADVHGGNYALSVLWLNAGHALVTDTDVGTITSGQTINGTINQSGDLDAAFFTAGAGDTVTITMGDRTGSSAYDLRVYLYDPSGAYIASASGESSATINTIITNAGQHTVVMRENDVHTGGYNISLTLVPADPPETIDLSVYSPVSYGGSQDADSSQYEVLDSGATLRMWGNNWKAINYPYEVTTNTVIEFDFRSTGSLGEINGVCFDADLNISDGWTFEVYGSQTWGLQDYHDYSGSDWVHYTIPVGEFYTGTFSYFGFVNDADGGQATDVYYRNIHIYEDE